MALAHREKQLADFETKYAIARLKAQGTRAPEDIEAARTVCLDFKDWCIKRRAEAPQILGDPEQDRESWQRFIDDVATRLRELEEDCPPGKENDPPPGAPDERPVRRIRIP